ncbi:Pyruvate dehydrogenase E1 component beta subunit [Mycoplasmoides gallisepticum CA06_2006.052-5-2P]|uniref:Pyruvate dehydrogenase E1 component beta subunit n=1 Tax=Mycoplasmoides gallisepticum WI01_2001.043-13-2P TaxID=1159201 RepID=J3YT75_MYCGL|nr:alpha-ketoacid dehydrogenase subunit beta [Mycoplasmoides gallisepticum]AFP76049.1 Pyruvate dehydrogenase E1 component beta subunit [Mycoplasmoides gallisepticum VA94_7994-1-7P]AFP76816.1 Pyruvate dehydrogenase E1 component beta subunit [Mycoplasmoides gallisepticum NC95_13295-2-2P]AFP77570.1 Pyruvate dehydrogenase E1 component beta subunit [Mycoplasmoides gallisepticum NC96_1596-4-2P]AFP78341.1 Pyruvate dehydrogenase E1 component beta subunit [Mycoplasmoides gallisepticum NY01_2001.047-5-1P
MSDKIIVNNIEALNNALDIALSKDKSVVLYGQDAGFEGGVFRATKGLQQKHGADRVWDSPISEAAMTGAAIGASFAGLKPIVEIQFSGFSYVAMQQLFCHAARIRNRSRGKLNAPIVIRMPMGGGIKALEHHSESLEAIYAHIPGVKVVMPCNPYDTKGLMLAAINDPDPVVFFEPKKLYRSFKQEIPAGEYVVEIGKANVLTQGSKLTIVTYGANVIDTLEIVNQYPAGDLELIDLRTISPIDWNTVLGSVQKTGRLLVIHEAVKSFSVSAEIMARVSETLHSSLKKAPVRVTGFDITVPLAKGEAIQFDLKKRTVDAINELLA